MNRLGSRPAAVFSPLLMLMSISVDGTRTGPAGALRRLQLSGGPLQKAIDQTSGQPPPHPLFRSTKQAPPARRMRLQRSSASGRVSAPIRT